MSIVLNTVLGILTLLYPFAVYFGLEHLSPRIFIVILLGLFVFRFILKKPAIDKIKRTFILLAMAVFSAFVFLQNSETGLRFYPVLVNISMLSVFSYSLFQPPSIIERLARLQEPNLPASGVIYTRKVTMAWCLFFILNASIALYTAVYCSLKVWSLYNGLIAYILMGLLFTIEYGIRIIVKRREADTCKPTS